MPPTGTAGPSATRWRNVALRGPSCVPLTAASADVAMDVCDSGTMGRCRCISATFGAGMGGGGDLARHGRRWRSEVVGLVVQEVVDILFEVEDAEEPRRRPQTTTPQATRQRRGEAQRPRPLSVPEARAKARHCAKARRRRPTPIRNAIKTKCAVLGLSPSATHLDGTPDARGGSAEFGASNSYRLDGEIQSTTRCRGRLGGENTKAAPAASLATLGNRKVDLGRNSRTSAQQLSKDAAVTGNPCNNHIPDPRVHCGHHYAAWAMPAEQTPQQQPEYAAGARAPTCIRPMRPTELPP